MKRMIAVVLLLSLLLTGCAADTPAQSGGDMMENVKPNQIAYIEPVQIEDAAVTDFGLRLFRQTLEDGKNTLISPLSVLYALSMTANGAQGNTLSQMETVLGMPVDSLNGWLGNYMADFSQPDREKLHLANAIWFKDDPLLTVEESFLQTNADYYGAGIYKAPFDDTTLKDINRYVEEHTNGTVKDILDEIPEDAVMYLVNALAFEAKWQKVYEEYQVQEGIFTTQAGEEQTVDMMYSTEHSYLEDDLATGFLKYYEDRRFAFAALLPKEGVTVSEYVQSLTGEKLQQLLQNPQDITVHGAIPKFETNYDAQLQQTLQTMGMTDAFDWTAADFSRMGSYEDKYLCIDRVLHKTHISVTEQGTKAGAATVVEMVAMGAVMVEEFKTVTLDRPFLYMIIDTKTQAPLFIGCLEELGE